MEGTIIKLLDENNNEIVCEILFVFECPSLGKNYIAYKCNIEGKEKEVFISNYNPGEKIEKLEPITDRNELIIAMDTLGEIMEEYEEA